MNFRFLTRLAAIDDDECLAAWLRETLEHLMSTIEAQEDFTPPLLVTKALKYIRDHIADDLNRDEVARHAGISPSHFSRLLKEPAETAPDEPLVPAVSRLREALEGPVEVGPSLGEAAHPQQLDSEHARGPALRLPIPHLPVDLEGLFEEG